MIESSPASLSECCESPDCYKVIRERGGLVVRLAGTEIALFGAHTEFWKAFRGF